MFNGLSCALRFPFFAPLPYCTYRNLPWSFSLLINLLLSQFNGAQHSKMFSHGPFSLLHCGVPGNVFLKGFTGGPVGVVGIGPPGSVPTWQTRLSIRKKQEKRKRNYRELSMAVRGKIPYFNQYSSFNVMKFLYLKVPMWTNRGQISRKGTVEDCL